MPSSPAQETEIENALGKNPWLMIGLGVLWFLTVWMVSRELW